jgi:GDP-4-dehydro-6-deoxy-D-mannose reductase
MKNKPLVWITGAGGFAGRHLIRHLRSLPDAAILIGLGRRPADIAGLDLFLPADLTVPESLAECAALHPPDIVYHFAGAVPPAASADMWLTNVAGTHHLLQTFAATAKRRIQFLLVSSAAVYLPCRSNLTEDYPAGGITPYGRSKWAQEAVALAGASRGVIDVRIARLFNLVGPGLPSTLVAGSLCAQFLQGGSRPVTLGRLTAQRDFIDVRDAVTACHTILSRGRCGTVYNVCTGRATRISTLVDHFQKASGHPRKVISSDSTARSGDADRAVGDNTRLRALGWKPVIPLRRSVTDMLREW